MQYKIVFGQFEWMRTVGRVGGEKIEVEKLISKARNVGLLNGFL